ncbi:MAG: hypothetical protein HYZ53_22480 [Planctomycetes bacterium]|nr:hypothetical protein [Planctomycetota bacterium]
MQATEKELVDALREGRSVVLAGASAEVRLAAIQQAATEAGLEVQPLQADASTYLDVDAYRREGRGVLYVEGFARAAGQARNALWAMATTADARFRATKDWTVVLGCSPEEAEELPGSWKALAVRVEVEA